MAGVALMCLSAACSQLPTAPTSTTGGATIGLVSLEPPPVPPRLGPGLTTSALGATSFVAFGDSITAGTLSSFDGMFLYDVPSHAYSERLRLALNQYHAPQTFTIVNEGVPGETASQGERRIGNVLATRRPQALLLLEGVNDMNGGVTAVRAASSVAQMVNIARLYNVTVLVALMPQTYEVTTPNGVVHENSATQIVPFNSEIRRLTAGLQNVHVVDLHASFGANRSYMGGDGLHPSEAGYQRMAQEFLAAIERVFPVTGGVQ
jgi:lysophospholipase L1-like esterase